MNLDYQDPIIKKYADLIQSKTNSFKRIYYGDPIRISASELPALVITKNDTMVENFSNTEDKHTIRLNFTIVADVRNTIGEDPTMVRGINNLYDLMEGRKDDYTLKSNCLVGILRNNVEIDPAQNLRTDLSGFTKVDYGMTIDKRGENSFAMEGVVEINANFIQIR